MKISLKLALLFEATIAIIGLSVPIALYLKRGPYDFFFAVKLFLTIFILFHLALISGELLKFWIERSGKSK